MPGGPALLLRLLPCCQAQTKPVRSLEGPLEQSRAVAPAVERQCCSVTDPVVACREGKGRPQQAKGSVEGQSRVLPRWRAKRCGRGTCGS